MGKREGVVRLERSQVLLGHGGSNRRSYIGRPKKKGQGKESSVWDRDDPRTDLASPKWPRRN